MLVPGRYRFSIASRLVGASGRVIGFDMTAEMLKKAQAGAMAMGAANVEFREGLAESLPLPDKFADVVISNGVLNLTLDKTETLRNGFVFSNQVDDCRWAIF